MEITNFDELRRQIFSTSDYRLSSELKSRIAQANSRASFYQRHSESPELYMFTFNESDSLGPLMEKLWKEVGFTSELIACLYHRYPDRPKIDMGKFLFERFGLQVPLIAENNILKRKQLLDSSEKCFGFRDTIYVPVIRYENRHNGVYYNDSVAYVISPVESTFYYLEEDSPWLLRFNSAIIGMNKIQLCLYFGMSYDEILQVYKDKFKNRYTENESEIRKSISQLLSQDYDAKPELYGFDATLDETLRIQILKAGYETAILTRMVYFKGFEVEIMDVRNRYDSFANISKKNISRKIKLNCFIIFY